MLADIYSRSRQWWQRIELNLFPEINIYSRQIPVITQLLAFVVLTAAFSLVGVFLPANDHVGWDWVYTFSIHKVFAFYPPWTYYITDRLNWPLMVGLPLAAYTLAVMRRSVHPLSAVAAFVTLPLFWATFLGQLEGLVLTGLLWLPWMAPLALVKPQVSIFAFFSRKSFLIAGLVVLILSLLVWGFWPVDSLHSLMSQGNVGAKRADNDISLGLWGIPIALALLWFSRGDMDMLMFAGVFALPYFLPYHLMVAGPAISRLKPGRALVAMLLSWSPLMANWLGAAGWWLGWVYVAWVWLNLAAMRYPRSLVGKWLS